MSETCALLDELFSCCPGVAIDYRVPQDVLGICEHPNCDETILSLPGAD